MTFDMLIDERGGSLLLLARLRWGMQRFYDLLDLHEGATITGVRQNNIQEDRLDDVNVVHKGYGTIPEATWQKTSLTVQFKQDDDVSSRTEIKLVSLTALSLVVTACAIIHERIASDRIDATHQEMIGIRWCRNADGKWFIAPIAIDCDRQNESIDSIWERILTESNTETWWWSVVFNDSIMIGQDTAKACQSIPALILDFAPQTVSTVREIWKQETGYRFCCFLWFWFGSASYHEYALFNGTNLFREDQF